MRLAIVTVPAPDYTPNLNRRPEWMRELGRHLHPETITNIWYAQNCPPKLDRWSLPLTMRVQWTVECWLRGVHR
jgi:hypothetical protein